MAEFKEMSILRFEAFELGRGDLEQRNAVFFGLGGFDPIEHGLAEIFARHIMPIVGDWAEIDKFLAIKL